jgi:hypothetical protein
VFGRKKRRDCVHVDKLKQFHGRPSYFKSKRGTIASKTVNRQKAQNDPRPEMETSGVRQSCPDVEASDCRGATQRLRPIVEPSDRRVECQRSSSDVKTKDRCGLPETCPEEKLNFRKPRLIYDNLGPRNPRKRLP